MEVSLVVRNHKLQYDPPLEELRLQHLTQHLQPFLALPLRMKGVSSLSERAGFFAPIAHAYPAATAKVSRSPVPKLCDIMRLLVVLLCEVACGAVCRLHSRGRVQASLQITNCL